MLRRCAICAILAVGIALPQAAGRVQPAGVIGYDLLIVEPLDGHRSSTAVGIDAQGRLVGRSTPISGGSTAIAWVNGQRLALPVPPGYRNPTANAISASSGVIVGYSIREQDSLEQATAWVLGGGVHVLPNIPDALSGIAMNSDDASWPETRIAGRCAAFGPDYATVWVNGSARDIGGPSSAATDTNKAGDVIGTWRNAQGAIRPVMWRGSERIDLGGEPTNASGSAYAINNFGEVVGHLGGFGPFLWRNGERLPLEAPSACWTIPHGLNDAGFIVGEYSTDPQCRAGYEHALLWTPEGQAHRAIDLNDHIPRSTGLELAQAWDVNEAGQIAAVAKLTDGNRRGVLLNPYHFEMSAPAPGTAGMRNTFSLSGLEPDEMVALLWSLEAGATTVAPPCHGATILLKAPQMIQLARSNGQGQAQFSVHVPGQARGRTVRFQAAVPKQCKVSHVVIHTFN